MTPIFIFSLPRSGSTLLQKIIASSDQVSTSAEPWILLPLLYSQKENGTLAEYSHIKSVKALYDVKQKIIDNAARYDEILLNYILSLYEALSDPKSKYFLDKTPRYYLIIEEISKILPHAKFIFLFRNPLAHFSSKIMIHNNSFRKIGSADVDIFKGPNLLANGYKKLQDKSIRINYEELVNSSDVVIEELEKYLDIDIDKSVLQNLSSISIDGRMGNPSLMSNKSNEISSASVDKWKTVFNSPLRKMIAAKYLETIDEEYYLAFGTSKKHIIGELKKVKVRYFNYPLDYLDYIYYRINRRYKPYIFYSKRMTWAKNIRLD